MGDCAFISIDMPVFLKFLTMVRFRFLAWFPPYFPFGWHSRNRAGCPGEERYCPFLGMPGNAWLARKT